MASVRFITSLTATIILLVAGFVFFNFDTKHSSALSGSSFKAGRIISDSLFYSGSTLSTSQIQNFLNAKVPDCDTDGTKPYGGTTRAQYGTSRGYPPPYICLKNKTVNTTSKSANAYCNAYSGGTKSAAKIIHDVGKACGISQKVLLVLLQKEQSLVTDDWPWSIQYRSATGYGCPDTAACDSQYYGFFNQVYNAARQYNRYKQNPENYGHLPFRTNSVRYHPNASCGNKSVNISNYATAGLYNYTPYTPNGAALHNLYGTGNSCSSYGNRNFWRLYNDWFGSTLVYTPPYAWSVVSKETFSNPAMSSKFTSKTTVEPNGKIYVRIKARNTGYEVWDQSFLRLGTYGPKDRNSTFEDSSWPHSQRPAGLVESTVFPGDIGTFEFILDAPSSTGGYNESFNAVAEGRVWLNDGNADISINIVEAISPDSTNSSLSVGEKLNPGEYLVSSDRQSILILQKDGNLVNYRNFKPVWNTQTSGKKAKFLIMQSDGNLVLYKQDGTPLWHSKTNGNSGSTLQLQTDGNLVIYSTGSSPVWFTGSTHNPNLLRYVNTTLTSSLRAQQLLETPDRKYKLILQGDGNLVLYKQDGTPLWHSKTNGKSGQKLVVQGDGNLVLYASSGKALWNTRTNGKGSGNRLVLQKDGNLVLYKNNGKPLWHTNTYNN